MNRKTILISPADSNIYNFFERHYNVISSEYLEDYISFERYHADLQALRIKDKLFVDSKCRNLCNKLMKLNIEHILCNNIGSSYPQNVALNAALTGNKLICNIKALHPKVKEYCISSGINLINVKQGYACCSTLVVSDNAIITDDVSIAKAAKLNDIEVLKIDKDNIILDEKNIGFIGGGSAKIGDSVYFFGDINQHRNSEDIIKFITEHKLNIVNVSDRQIVDIGGLVIIN